MDTEIVGLSLIIQMYLWSNLFIHWHKWLSPMFTANQISNFVSVVHNLGCIGFCMCYWWTQWNMYIYAICVWSMSYFYVDSLNYTKDSILRIHHHASICMEIILYLLYLDPTNINGLAVFWGLFCCELSNHPMYYIYHRRKAVSPVRLNPVWYLIESIMFVLPRTYCALQYLWITPVTNVYLWYSILGFWTTSVYWGWGMLQHYITAK